MKRPRIALVSLALLILCVGALYAAFHSITPPTATPLASYAPSGALLAIESPDFASVLSLWTSSTEKHRWLASDNYAGFSRSRLFTRLQQAQDEFATTAGLPPDIKFMQQIAGKQSLLAWYDIGNLEFLYITKLPPGDAAKTPLLQLRDRFETRTTGPSPFYVRTQDDPARTVAFAVSGDYLLLATREDLLANALQLMNSKPDQSVGTLKSDPWYAQTVVLTSKTPGDLRMTLNLAKLVPSPYFRSYWIQQNITEMKQYTAALSDLYRTPDTFREERILLPAQTSKPLPTEDLSNILDLVPASTGVYRAQAQPSTQAILDQLEDKLLSRAPNTFRNLHIAPAADLSTPTNGSASDLEQRIDEPLVTPHPREAALSPLRNLLSATPPLAMLTFSTAAAPAESTASKVFLPIHTAVAFTSTTPWNPAAVQQALTAALAPRLSVGSVGLTWSEHRDSTSSWYELNGPHTLALAITDKLCIIASDRDTLSQLQTASSKPKPHEPTRTATVIAGFNHRTERDSFYRMTNVLDHSTPPQQPDQDNSPAFFSRNMASISRVFQDLDAETFTESTSPDNIVHQTVLYQGHPK
jgi:hypothetical protein